MIYFVRMNHNPMNSNDKYATPCRDPLVKTYRIVINLFSSPKWGLLVLSNIVVMFSVRGDSIWATLLPRTLAIGFEHWFVVGIMPFRFACPKIVIKLLFPISMIYYLLPSGRGGVTIWDFMFCSDIFHHENIIYYNF